MPDTLTSIAASDVRGQKQLDALLEREGIRRDAHLDYTCGIFDDDWHLIATGSCFHNTIRCLAVSGEHQGEGLLNRVVTHLMEVQVERGNLHVFLYTKPGSAKFFGDLGFSEIARLDELVFMENRRNGFDTYLKRLEKVSTDRCAAVVMNANPFTLGHRYLVEKAASENECVHLFLLSEEAGPIPFVVRKRLVQEGTADLPNVIIHDSGPYIISSATFPSYFLRDEDAAIRAHAALDLTIFARIASAVSISVRYVGDESISRVTALYNDIMAKKLPELGIGCVVVPRLEKNGRIVSASTVRQAIHDNAWESMHELVPESTWRYFTSPEAEQVIRAICEMKNPKHY